MSTWEWIEGIILINIWIFSTISVVGWLKLYRRYKAMNRTVEKLEEAVKELMEA